GYLLGQLFSERVRIPSPQGIRKNAPIVYNVQPYRTDSLEQRSLSRCPERCWRTLHQLGRPLSGPRRAPKRSGAAEAFWPYSSLSHFGQRKLPLKRTRATALQHSSRGAP